MGDASVKQGAYGKVKIHKHSKLRQLLHLDEVYAGLKYLMFKHADGMHSQIDRDGGD
jgi:hypothetical protein